MSINLLSGIFSRKYHYLVLPGKPAKNCYQFGQEVSKTNDEAKIEARSGQGLPKNPITTFLCDHIVGFKLMPGDIDFWKPIQYFQFKNDIIDISILQSFVI